MVKTAFVRSVKPARAAMAAVEKFSAQPFIEGPTKSKTAAKSRRPGEDEGAVAAALAGDEDLGRGARLGVGELAVQVADEVAAERGEEEDAEDGAEQGHEEDLEEGRAALEAEDVDRGHREDRAAGHDPGGGPDREDVDVLEEGRGAPGEDAHDEDREAHREDRDRDGRLDPLAELQRDVGGGGGEDDRPEDALDDASATVTSGTRCRRGHHAARSARRGRGRGRRSRGGGRRARDVGPGWSVMARAQDRLLVLLDHRGGHPTGERGGSAARPRRRPRGRGRGSGGAVRARCRAGGGTSSGPTVSSTSRSRGKAGS